MGIFDKKFKVRVRLFAEDKYTVEYCWYRIIPVWHSLCFWFDQGHPSCTECWSVDLWSAKDAEAVAGKLKSTQDVHEYYKPEEAEEKKWIAAEAVFQKENIPYRSKRIL